MFPRGNLCQWNRLLVFSISILIIHFLDVGVTHENIEDDITNKKVEIEFDTREDDEEAVRPHYALDPRQSRKLALSEEHLYNSLIKILMSTKISPVNGEPDPCHIYSSKYLLDYKMDTNAVNGETGIARANRVRDNPILVLRMIRRMFVILLNETRVSCKKMLPDLEWEIEITFNEAGSTPPTEQDLNDALLGLLRIQYVYGLNATSQIRLGNLNGIHTGALLYFDDCMALAEMAIKIKAEAMAYQWLKSARLCPHESEKSEEQLYKDTEYLEQVWLKLLKMTKFGSWKLLHNKLENKRQDRLDGFSHYSSYATCRGRITMPAKDYSKLFCFYAKWWDPYFYINPVKAEVLSKDPTVFQFYEFVNNETIAYLKELASEMTRSGVVSSTTRRTEYKSMRTSMHSWIWDSEEFNPPEILVKWNRRVEKLTGLKVMKEGSSQALSVVLYGSLGGHYDIHNDALQNSNAPIDILGDRIATVLTFLSDTELGGYTAFPRAGVFAKPVKGSAILWYNLHLNGNTDYRTEHCGCPVILGTKQVANRWILQYENMWNFPCSRDRYR